MPLENPVSLEPPDVRVSSEEVQVEGMIFLSVFKGTGQEFGKYSFA